VAGEQQILAPDDADVLAILRTHLRSGQVCLTALNFSAATRSLNLGDGQGRTLHSTHRDEGAAIDMGALTLGPFEVLVAEVS
jgi:hypothetical protein